MHAAAIVKAEAKGDAWLADRIYSGVPAGTFGRKQEICIGYMSGASNVNYWLKQRGIASTPALVNAILVVAKRADHILILEEGCVAEYGVRTQLATDPSSRFYHLMQTGMQEALA